MPRQRLRWSRILAIQSCPGCSRKLRVADGKQGTVTCPHCGSEWLHPETIGLSKTKTTSGYIKWFASCAAIAFALIYYVCDVQQSKLAVQAKRDLENAVTVFSQGTQEAWIGYVDRRIAATIQP